MSPGSFRVLKTINLLLAARDSGVTKHAEFNVLNQLILRSNPDDAYSCFPSYQQMQLDTRLSPRKIKDAIAALQTAKLIKVISRPHHSNKYFVRADKILGLAKSNLAARKATEQAEEQQYRRECGFALESECDEGVSEDSDEGTSDSEKNSYHEHYENFDTTDPRSPYYNMPEEEANLLE